MRRLFAILLIGAFVFLLVYGLVPFVKDAVNGFFISWLGPTIVNTATGTVGNIVGVIGLGGFAAIILGLGAIGGILVHFLWVKADWRLRRWGHTRTSKDLGLNPVSNISTTPANATTRPEVKATPAPAPVAASKSKPQPKAAPTPAEPVPETEK